MTRGKEGRGPPRRAGSVPPRRGAHGRPLTGEVADPGQDA